ncbi:hypothetical protein BZA77DRAFT_295372 [Pyronema omphalodes]|nr:hypothetical protein BZA77DRAFT_295372 [Pyronema omphalodes]
MAYPFHQSRPSFVPPEPIGQSTGYYLPTYQANTEDIRYFSPEEFHAWTAQYARVLAEISNRIPPMAPLCIPGNSPIPAHQLPIPPPIGFIPNSPYMPTHDPIFNNSYKSWITAAYDFSILLPGSWDGADRLCHTDYIVYHVGPETTLQWIYRLAYTPVVMVLGFLAWFMSLAMLVLGVFLAVGLWLWLYKAGWIHGAVGCSDWCSWGYCVQIIGLGLEYAERNGNSVIYPLCTCTNDLSEFLANGRNMDQDRRLDQPDARLIKSRMPHVMLWILYI